MTDLNEGVDTEITATEKSVDTGESVTDTGDSLLSKGTETDTSVFLLQAEKDINSKIRHKFRTTTIIFVTFYAIAFAWAIYTGNDLASLDLTIDVASESLRVFAVYLCSMITSLMLLLAPFGIIATFVGEWIKTKFVGVFHACTVAVFFIGVVSRLVL